MQVFLATVSECEVSYSLQGHLSYALVNVLAALSSLGCASVHSSMVLVRLYLNASLFVTVFLQSVDLVI